jgi:hypothetical protein
LANQEYGKQYRRLSSAPLLGEREDLPKPQFWGIPGQNSGIFPLLRQVGKYIAAERDFDYHLLARPSPASRPFRYRSSPLDLLSRYFRATFFFAF